MRKTPMHLLCPIAGTLIALAAPVAAEPQPTCEVRFVRAPDDVRHVIEAWLAAEPRCTSTINLRVVPTDDGFYLLAQRPDGRIHERLVPDAQSAGVLVASWVADDWVAPDADNAPVASPPVAPMVYAGPAETPAVIAISEPRRSGGPRWMTVGALFSADRPDHDGGLRLELDVISSGRLTLGAALAWTETRTMVSSYDGYGEVRSSDYAATITGAYTLRTDRWEVRGALGFGGVYSDVDGELLTSSQNQPWSMEPFVGNGGGLMGTISLAVTRRIGERWGIHAGLVGHVIAEQFPTSMGNDLAREDSHLFLFTGLRRRI